MLDCREQKTIEKLSEELEKAGYTHISFQVVHTKSRTTSVRGHKSVKKQDSEEKKSLTGQLFREQKI